MTQETGEAPQSERQPPLIAVVDTNVFARAAWYKPIVDAVEDGRLLAWWSPFIICEVNRLLTWFWIRRHGGDLRDAAWRRCSADFKTWHANVAAHLRVIEDRPPLEPMWTDDPPDPWDAPIWTAAVRVGRLYPSVHVMVITENLRDAPPANADGLQAHAGVVYVHPTQALAVISALTNRSLPGGPAEADAFVSDSQANGSVEPLADETTVAEPAASIRALLALLEAEPPGDA